MTETLTTPSTSLAERAARHRALGDETRLVLVDALQVSDRSPQELAALVGASSNLLAFHLNVLEEAGLVRRIASQGDARRRYVTLVRDRLTDLDEPRPLDAPAERVLFVCTANAARSQLAAHLWRARTGLPALSAGTDPAPRVHPEAVAVARRGGLDLGGSSPVGYREVDVTPDLVVSVCDRAHESPITFDAPLLHWSVADPVGGGPEDFARTFQDLTERIDRLARALPVRDGLARAATHPAPRPEDTP
jgi:ArsR family transcriptional regulator, arsenate/arsenite/antimonite-responsive transcriptional repressor / arsenate reductase (thioredoxin)